MARHGTGAAGRQDPGFQRGGVLFRADYGTGMVGLAVVAGQHRPGGGDDVDGRGDELVADGYLLPGVAGRHGAGIAVPGHQRLRRQTRASSITAGNGRAGTDRGGPAAARLPTVTVVPAALRVRASPRSRHQASSRACARAGVRSSGRVRHHRCAAEWLAFPPRPCASHAATGRHRP